MKKSLIVMAALCMVMTSLASADFTYTQNFDSIGTTTSAPERWTIGTFSGNPSRLQDAGNGRTISPMALVVSNGYILTDNNRTLNLGSTGSSDRALGNYPKTALGDHVIQVELTNDTAVSWASISLAYKGEQWIRAQNQSSSGVEKLRVYYSNTTATTGFVSMGASFEFTAPDLTVAWPTPVAIDGNVTATLISGTFTLPAPLAPGDKMWIRWLDWNDNGTSDIVMGIDDVVVTAIPEPATMSLLVLGGLALLRRRTK